MQNIKWAETKTGSKGKNFIQKKKCSDNYPDCDVFGLQAIHVCSSFSTTAFSLVHAWKVWLPEYPNPGAKKGYKMQDKTRLADGQNPQPCDFASSHPLHW